MDILVEEADNYVSAESSGSLETTLRVKKTKKSRKVVINIAQTKYPIVREVARHSLKWRLSRGAEEEHWNVLWTDGAVSAERLARMKAYQKINHFPGTHAISRKNQLASNLKKMRVHFPEDYTFFPDTWLYPAESTDLRTQFAKRPKKIFIVKPEASCQGRGIFLTSDFEAFKMTDRYVVQEYIQNPLLIDGLKFDIRLYVLLASCEPLCIYLHKEGLARFATESYERPGHSNLNNEYVHLTNYAINKHSEAFIFNKDAEKDGVGHKRSFSAILESLQEAGMDIESLLQDISGLIVKTICAVQPALAHSYKLCQSSPGMCFEVLGFDILIDKNLKPWLLEVNHSPSFSTDSPLDHRIKTEVVKDTLNMLKVSAKDKKKYETKKKNDIINRSIYGKQSKRHIFESSKKKSKQGGYIKIFPSDDYTKFLEGAGTLWSDKVRFYKTAVKVRPSTNAIRRNSTGLSTQINSRRPVSPSFFERLSKPIQRETKTIIYQAKKDPKAVPLLSQEKGQEGIWQTFRQSDQPMTIKSVLPAMETNSVKSNKLFLFSTPFKRSWSKNPRK